MNVLCFDEPGGSLAVDSSGFGNDGIYRNGPRLGVAGAIAGDPAVGLDGRDDFIQVPDSPSLDVGDTFTLEAWIRRATTRDTQQLFTKGANGFQLVVNGGKSQVILRKAGFGPAFVTKKGVPAHRGDAGACRAGLRDDREHGQCAGVLLAGRPGLGRAGRVRGVQPTAEHGGDPGALQRGPLGLRDPPLEARRSSPSLPGTTAGANG